MKRDIELLDQKIEYTIAFSKRARRLSLSIYNDGRVRVTLPKRIPEDVAHKFLAKKAEWVVTTIERFKKRAASHPHESSFLKLTKADYARHKETARELVEKKISHFNRFYNFKFKTISIKNQKSRWGSCSRSGNLNFNYKIALLTERQAEYIVVHELCHLGEFNHSQNFWKLVEKTIPDYREIKAELKRIHISH